MHDYIETKSNFAAQFPRNLIANIAYFGINVIIGIIIAPYFISNLGVAAYGIIPLATSISGYAAIIVVALNAAVSRYLTVDLQKEDFVAANKTFNTAVFTFSAIIAMTIPVIIVFSYYVPQILNVPIAQESDVIILFISVCTATLIRLWSGNFSVQLFAYNRIDYQNIVNITSLLVQTGLIFLLFSLYSPNLTLVGIAYLTGAISSSIVAIILANKVCPTFRISIRDFEWSRLNALCKMGGWIIIDQIGTLLFLQIDLILVNLLLGATPAGEYAIVLIWVTLLWGIANTIAGILTPMTYTYYAKEDIGSLTKLMVGAVKYMGLLIALPIGLICGFAPQILTIWVGKQFSSLASLMILMVLPLSINLAVLPLFSINVAYNRIRVPGIVTLIMGGMNITLAVILSLFLGWGFYGVAAAGAIVLTMRHLVFVPWYATRVMEIKTSTFIRSMVPGIVAAITLFIVSSAIGNFFYINSLVALITSGSILILAYIMLVWRFGLSMYEQEFIKSYLQQKFNRIKNKIDG